MPSPYRHPDEKPEPPPIPATAADLGRVTTQFRAPTIGRAMRGLVIIGPCVAVSLVSSYLAARGETPPWLVFAANGGILGVVAFYYASFAIAASAAVRVHEDGFVVEARRGERVVRWDDVDGFYVDYEVVGLAAQPSSVEYRVTTFAGDEIRFGRGLVDAGSLDGIFATRVSRKLLPDARRALEEGGALRFGALTMTAEGLSVGNDQLAWSEVDKIEASLTTVFVHKRAAMLRWKTFKLAQISHPWLFFTLSRERANVIGVC